MKNTIAFVMGAYFLGAIITFFMMHKATPEVTPYNPTKHNIVIKWNGEDKTIPKDGTWVKIIETREDTVIIDYIPTQELTQFVEDSIAYYD